MANLKKQLGSITFGKNDCLTLDLDKLMEIVPAESYSNGFTLAKVREMFDIPGVLTDEGLQAQANVQVFIGRPPLTEEERAVVTKKSGVIKANKLSKAEAAAADRRRDINAAADQASKQTIALIGSFGRLDPTAIALIGKMNA